MPQTQAAAAAPQMLAAPPVVMPAAAAQLHHLHQAVLAVMVWSQGHLPAVMHSLRPALHHHSWQGLTHPTARLKSPLHPPEGLKAHARAQRGSN